jgi:quaternary ammonium compound-resistance protein SugE
MSHLTGMAINSINPWLALIIAGVLEVIWASSFKFVSLQRPLASLAVAATMIASFFFLWLATQKLPIGTAYAIWTGIGAVGAASVGILLFGEPATVLRMVCIVLIVAGIVGLKLFSGAAA